MDTDILDSLTNYACEHLPVVKRTISQFGDNTMEEYLRSINKNNRDGSIQPQEDLCEAVIEYLTPLLGQTIAEKVGEDILELPIISTSNHHGIDFFAQSVQGDILFYLSKLLYSPHMTTVPIFSCGGISLSNPSYPRGIIVYESGDAKKTPLKLPILPDKSHHQMVSSIMPFTKEMIRNCIKSFEKNVYYKILSKNIANSAVEILEEQYSNDFVLSQARYGEQAVIINHALGKKMFNNSGYSPDFTYIEFEAIAATLLKKDLKNKGSLAYAVFFHEELRKNILKNLDGKKVCWNHYKLNKLTSESLSNIERHALLGGSGTVFFWGIDKSNIRIPLYLTECSGGTPELIGVDSNGDIQHFSFTAEEIQKQLDEHKIIPSLFTSFLVISFARGFNCVGGYFQGDYLLEIQKGIILSMFNKSEYSHFIDGISSIACGLYLSGLMGSMVKGRNDILVPAGPIEIISRGGLRKEHIDNILSVSIKQAQEMGLYDLYPDISSANERTSDWQQKLGEAITEKYKKFTI